MNLRILLVSFLFGSVIESKPLKTANDDVKNEIEHGNIVTKETESPDGANKFSRRTESSPERANESIDQKIENNDSPSVESSSVKPQQSDNFVNLLLPLLHRWKFSPQIFFQDRLNLLKQSLENLGFVVPSNNATTSKQFAGANGLLNLVGLNDSGFYTDRFEPAGFLGGNGWFANKGGILGGPGAIISTGSLLTDYPTPYKK